MTGISEINPKPWYAVQTRSKCEKSSAAILAEKGYEVFCPTRRKGTQEQPLFPCYLFCRATTDMFGRVVTTPGVIRLLGRPGKPEAVSAAEIASVRRLVETGLDLEANNRINVGDRVRICRGPLTGVEGDIFDTAGGTRLAVSVCILQRFISVQLESSWLEPIAAEAAA